jgi:hypothetical protein
MTTTLSAEHAAAIRCINAAYNRLTPHEQQQIELHHDHLEDELGAARASGDTDRALAAIQTWREHWVAVLADNGSARPDPRTAPR